jgi:hypothetical protein
MIKHNSKVNNDNNLGTDGVPCLRLYLRMDEYVIIM